MAPRKWLDDLGAGEGTIPSWPATLACIAAAGASVAGVLDKWIPWHMAVWALAAPPVMVAVVGILQLAVLRPLGGRAGPGEVVRAWSLALAPLGAVMPISLWVVLHSPRDPFGLSGIALLADLLTKAALVYGAVLGCAAAVAVNRFDVREHSSREAVSWWAPRDLALILAAPRRLFAELRDERVPVLGSPHLGSALLVATAVGVVDAHARIEEVSSLLPALYQVIPTEDIPELAPHSDWAFVPMQVATVLIIIAVAGLLPWWLSRALRGGARLGQTTVAVGLSLTPLLLFYLVGAVGGELGRWHWYLGVGTAGWSVALCALAMVTLNPESTLWRRAVMAGLAVMMVVAIGLTGRTEAYQRTLVVDYLRWLVWVAPPGEAEAHTRYELAMAKVSSGDRRKGDVSAAIPDLLGLAGDYPNSLAAYHAWDTMSRHYIAQDALDQAERCMRAVLAMGDSARFDAEAWHGRALLRLAEIESRRGDSEGAKRYLSQVAAQHPELREQAVRSLEMMADD